jgi:hypothetical protein
MAQNLISQLISLVKTVPLGNSAMLDLMKLILGSSAWIGGMVLFMYLRQRKLKESPINK